MGTTTGAGLGRCGKTRGTPCHRGWNGGGFVRGRGPHALGMNRGSWRAEPLPVPDRGMLLPLGHGLNLGAGLGQRITRAFGLKTVLLRGGGRGGGTSASLPAAGTAPQLRCPSSLHRTHLQKKMSSSLFRPYLYSVSGHSCSRCPILPHLWQCSPLRLQSLTSWPCSEHTKHRLKMQSWLSWSSFPQAQQPVRTFSAITSSERSSPK
mmetsp:Transcript_60308/g.194197  ORF Transcript_60308/g.194197 Transcript_60308/m.194197 type:complete len:207 (-) Transcript_60308:1256-1876(-)